MTREEQRRRDEQIALDRVLEMSEWDAAAKYNVDVRTVRRAYKKWKDGVFNIEDFDPIDAIHEYLLKLDRAAADLAPMRTHRNLSLRIRAILVQSRIGERKTRILLEVGAIPVVTKQHDAWRQEHAAQIQARLRDKARREELPMDLADWAAEGIEDWLKHAPRGLWSEKEDTFTHKDVRLDQERKAA